ncbi:deaminase [Chelatococcus sambhunathii]|uniref:Deaminase n=1 Tax=Chelatococcus sambhunathii TaxID=363953 RepID=A0ABU1DF94_9HYPH|nr:deaminase [Chelatococcus sambhunathii]
MNPGGAAPALPLTHAVRANGFVFISGQLPVTAAGELPDGFEAQLRQVLANLEAALEAAGSSFGKVVKTTVFMKDLNDFAALNTIYGEVFASQPPARSAYEVARLPRDALVEIEAVALA